MIVVPCILLLADAGAYGSPVRLSESPLTLAPPEVIGYACAFLGVTGFYMSVVFYAISLILNVICTSELSANALLPMSHSVFNDGGCSLHHAQGLPHHARLPRRLPPGPQTQALEGARGDRAVDRRLLRRRRLARHHLRQQHRHRLPHLPQRLSRSHRASSLSPLPLSLPFLAIRVSASVSVLASVSVFVSMFALRAPSGPERATD